MATCKWILFCLIEQFECRIEMKVQKHSNKSLDCCTRLSVYRCMYHIILSECVYILPFASASHCVPHLNNHLLVMQPEHIKCSSSRLLYGWLNVLAWFFLCAFKSIHCMHIVIWSIPSIYYQPFMGYSMHCLGVYVRACVCAWWDAVWNNCFYAL